jgi:hypothetical protein
MRDDFSITRFLWFGFAKQVCRQDAYLIADPDY